MSRRLKPIHPGEQLREEFMVPLDSRVMRWRARWALRLRASMRSFGSVAASAPTQRFVWRASSTRRISSG